MTFYRSNVLIGWILFALALFVYLVTLEPTASFWDCGEFIACAYKLQIAHPPGAPLYTLTGRLFAALASPDITNVAFFVNLLSAVCSALTIAFLYWTITLLTRKITQNKMVIIAAGITGSLSFAFTDSFWFSAVEAEVYAMSSLFSAITFWAILKWEKNADSMGSNRWLILIAYLLGLSVGVHLLNLLAIPTIVLIIYFKKYVYSRKGMAVAFLISIAISGFIFKIAIPGIPYLGAQIDKLFVNTFSLPFNSGFLFTILTMVSVLAWLSFKSYKTKNAHWQFIFTLFFVFTLGYSSYSTIVIRSLANPPVDMNNPDNPFSLISYLNREQYASRPLFYGNYYNSKSVSHEKRHTFVPFKNKYIQEPLNPKITYDKRCSTIFPRMASTDPGHAEAYKKWANINGRNIRISKNENITIPTFGENLRFFIRYQAGHMYFRYFMWNFVGRQNDVQGFGSCLNGNWISGINFIDRLVIGTDKVDPISPEANKSRNSYFFLPLLLGVAGMVFHYKSSKSVFIVLLTLFLMTGLAIVVYLNEIPVTPRERDYVYVGSFYTFAIWIGMGVPALYHALQKIPPFSRFMVVVVTSLSVPVLLFIENFDDHNRSNRFVARDLARNYLESCESNAILFTTADNDTYPLWYAQEVEGIRTDVSTVLLPYLSANWYIDQKRRKIYDSPALALSLTKDKFTGNQRNYVPVLSKINKPIELKQLLSFIGSENQKTKVQTRDSNWVNYLPSKHFFITKTLASGREIKITGKIEGNYLLKSNLVVLDILAHNGFQRPVYFLNPVLAKKLGLSDYLKREGLAYRLTTDKSEKYLTERNDKLLMKKFTWGNMNVEKVYLDWTSRRTVQLVLRIRNDFVNLAKAQYLQGNKKRALDVLKKCTEVLPPDKFPHDLSSLSKAELFYRCGDAMNARTLVEKFEKDSLNYLAYLNSFNQKDKGIHFEIKKYSYYLENIQKLKPELLE